MFSCRSLELQLKETGVIKGEGEGEKPLASAMDKLPPDVLEDVKGTGIPNNQNTEWCQRKKKVPKINYIPE